MLIIEFLNEFLVDSGLYIKLAKLIKEHSPRVMRNTLKLILFNDVLFVEHIQ